MKISLVQMELSDDLSINLEKHKNFIDSLKSNLIIFPECSLVGYNLKTLLKYKQKEYYHQLEKAVKVLVSTAIEKNISIILGAVEHDNAEFYNCGLHINSKGEIFCYRKITLTETEAEYFQAGNKPCIFKKSGIIFGHLICRDQSNLSLFSIMKEKKVQFLIIQSAHYYSRHIVSWKKQRNLAIPITRAEDYKFVVCKVNAVGSVNNLLAHGNSVFVDSKGMIIKILDDHQEKAITLDTENYNDENANRHS
ncbi:MAG: carbon-nitrogen hydrolase family protein [Candidatus Zixiibacteriota bacterium]